MITNHYGYTVDSDIPITGVVLTHNPEFLHEDVVAGIDHDFEMHLLECNNEDHDMCYDNDDPTYLVGFQVDGNSTSNETRYEPDDKEEYSAICTAMYTQVVRSKWVTRVALCSPCFPGQGDLDSEGDYLTYTLPPEVWGKTEHQNSKKSITGENK